MTRHGPSAPTTFVGTDVVDLADPRTHGKAADRRFVDRVLDDVEASVLRASPAPDVELWSLWACKEAAYKTATKLRGSPPVFQHAAFGVRWDGPRPTGETGTGRVDYDRWSIPVTVLRRRGVIQAVAYTQHQRKDVYEEIVLGLELLDDLQTRWGQPLDQLLTHFSSREADAVRSRPSAAVRMGARADLASMMRIDESRIEIVCDPGLPGRRPPRVFVDGSPADADVSLSHHGRWIAWAAHVGR